MICYEATSLLLSLHQRDLPLAEHRVPAHSAGAGDGGGQGMAATPLVAVRGARAAHDEPLEQRAYGSGAAVDPIGDRRTTSEGNGVT